MLYLNLESHEIRPEYQAGIPARLIESLVNYAEHRLMPGQFLQSVLANDLFGALSRGDLDAIGSLPILTEFIFNELPGEAWGSREKIAAWCAERIKHDLNLESEYTFEERQRRALQKTSEEERYERQRIDEEEFNREMKAANGDPY